MSRARLEGSSVLFFVLSMEFLPPTPLGNMGLVILKHRAQLRHSRGTVPQASASTPTSARVTFRQSGQLTVIERRVCEESRTWPAI